VRKKLLFLLSLLVIIHDEFDVIIFLFLIEMFAKIHENLIFIKTYCIYAVKI